MSEVTLTREQLLRIKSARHGDDLSRACFEAICTLALERLDMEPLTPPFIRPPSDTWKVGVIVRHRKGHEYFGDGQPLAVINRLHKDCNGRKSAEYQVFWVHLLDDDGVVNFSSTYWTTPHDVDYVADTLADYFSSLPKPKGT